MNERDTLREHMDAIKRMCHCSEWSDETAVEHLQKVAQSHIQRDRELEAEIYGLKDHLKKATRILKEMGYEPCNIPACNCGSFHLETPEPEV